MSTDRTLFTDDDTGDSNEALKRSGNLHELNIDYTLPFADGKAPVTLIDKIIQIIDRR